MKLKNHKAFTKRVHVTGTGKVLKRKSGQNHFNARESGNTTRNKRRDETVSPAFKKAVATLIHI